MIKKTYNVIGLMSGTSLDGLDICWVRFSKELVWKYEIMASETLNYDEGIKSNLKNAINLSSNDLNTLDKDYTFFLGGVINTFIKNKGINNIDAICNHGHTIFHKPENGITYQLGNLPELSNYLENIVVCDFRIQDVEMGGQGAPLVPIGDELLFSQYDYCINLGGFSNISFKDKSHRVAFDICPSNIVLNYYSSHIGLDFDNEGKLASQGELCKTLLNKLNSISFYKREYPKSLGYEWVTDEIIPLISKSKLDIKSILRTFVEHIAVQITLALKNRDYKNGLWTGGGIYNSFLINRISANLNYQIRLPADDLINYKEALIFAFLGVLRLRNDINCLSSVTGAINDHSSGKIYYPNQG